MGLTMTVRKSITKAQLGKWPKRLFLLGVGAFVQPACDEEHA